MEQFFRYLHQIHPIKTIWFVLSVGVVSPLVTYALLVVHASVTQRWYLTLNELSFTLLILVVVGIIAGGAVTWFRDRHMTD